MPVRADEGAALRSTNYLSLALKLFAAAPLSPLICPSGIFSPLGRRGIPRLLFILFILFAPLPAFAVNPDEMLADPALESRARTLSAELRCMVCQNQSIDDSNADLAKDLRLLVRERLTDGDSDEQVLNYIVSRYGEFVLLKPRLSAKTVLLWGAPVLLVLVGALSLGVFARRRVGKPTGSVLTEEEQAKLSQLLEKQ